jgi:ketosteroid isomerase-like protein
MTANENTITKFYTAFANSNAEQMCECYHPNVQFCDPIFGLLKGNEVCQMWEMLIERSKGNLKIEFSEIKTTEYTGSAQWIATYNFSKTNRKVVNTIAAKFHFKEGLIIKHTDDFDIWKWAKQAFGLKGLLLGWTGFMQNKIQKEARMSLKKYF